MIKRKTTSTIISIIFIIGAAYFSLSCTKRPARKYPNVVLILIDTLRADHLGCYGYSRDTSPHIDQLAKEGILFKNMLAQTSWTRPGTASILTGLYPMNHGAVTRDDRIPKKVRLLPEILGKHGFQTYAFVTNGNAGSPAGFKQGYTKFFRFKERPGSRDIHVKASEVNRSVLNFLREPRETSSNFIYIHYSDPHAPFTPEEKYFSKNDKIAFTIDYIRSMPIASMNKARRHEVIEEMINAYDDEIRCNDQMIGNVIQALKEKNMYSNSIIIITSDHGEEFYEHGGLSHGKTLYDEQLKIPLIIRFPCGIHAENGEIANQVDIVPTILSLLDIPIPQYLDGIDLLDNNKKSRPYSYAELNLDGNVIFSVRSSMDKLIKGIYRQSRQYNGKRWFRKKAVIETADDSLELIVRSFNNNRIIQVSMDDRVVEQLEITPKRQTINIPLTPSGAKKKIIIKSLTPCQVPKELGISRDPRCLAFCIFDSRNVSVKDMPGEPSLEYFTLTDDPVEKNNRYDQKQYKAFIVLLRKELKRFKSTQRFNRSGKSKKPIQFDKKQVKALEALGYL